MLLTAFSRTISCQPFLSSNLLKLGSLNAVMGIFTCTSVAPLQSLNYYSSSAVGWVATGFVVADVATKTLTTSVMTDFIRRSHTKSSVSGKGIGRCVGGGGEGCSWMDRESRNQKSRISLQQKKHARLYSDVLQALKRKPLIALGSH